jgi:hypothetical protein
MRGGKMVGDSAYDFIEDYKAGLEVLATGAVRVVNIRLSLRMPKAQQGDLGPAAQHLFEPFCLIGFHRQQ